MRKCLEDENYVADSRSSVAPASSIDVTAKTGQKTKKTTAAIAAEVADMLAASSSSQYIMSSVLSTFAAEQEKNSGLMKSSTASTMPSSVPNNAANNSMLKSERTMSDPNIFMPGKQLNSSQNNLQQIQPATLQGQITNSQAQYHLLSNPPSQQYLQPSGGSLSSYAYVSIPPLPPGPPAPTSPPPPHMGSPIAPLTHHQQLQINQQQPLIMGHQPSPLNQQPLPLPSQPLAPSFRPVAPMQLPGMVYYAPLHHSQ